jgi:putative sterol carrier protein
VVDAPADSQRRGDEIVGHHTRKEEIEDEMSTPSMDTIPGSFAALQAAFQPQKAVGVTRTLQFDFTGREPGTWNATVANGTFNYAQGAATNPDAAIAVDSDDWLKLLKGELDGMSAFMQGKIKVTPMSAAMGLLQFQQWFAR